MTPKTRRYFKIIIFDIAILALLFGAWTYHNTSHKKSIQPLSTATIFNEPRTITPFQLTDNKDQSFTLENLKGHWSLLFFGFTNCPDLCPTTLATLNQVYKNLQAKGQAPMPQIVFISVDPERDNPKRLTEYLHTFNSHFIGATGQQAQLDKLTQELSVLYAKVKQSPSNPEDYSIDHSGTILIIDPKGQFYGVFTTPHDATKISNDLEIMLAKSA